MWPLPRGPFFWCFAAPSSVQYGPMTLSRHAVAVPILSAVYYTCLRAGLECRPGKPCALAVVGSGPPPARALAAQHRCFQCMAPRCPGMCLAHVPAMGSGPRCSCTGLALRDSLCNLQITVLYCMSGPPLQRGAAASHHPHPTARAACEERQHSAMAMAHARLCT